MNIRLLWYRVPSLFQTLWLFPHFYLMIHLWEVSGWGGGGGGGFCDWETGQGWGSVELQRWNIWSRAERTTTTPWTIGRDNTGASLRQLGMSWCGVLTGSKSNTLKMKTVPSCKSSICSPHICVSGSSVWFCLPLLVLCVALRLWLDGVSAASAVTSPWWRVIQITLLTYSARHGSDYRLRPCPLIELDVGNQLRLPALHIRWQQTHTHRGWKPLFFLPRGIY